MTVTMGSGTITTMSRKQKQSNHQSTHAEPVGTNDVATMILWTKNLLEAQGYSIAKNILLQNNKSIILLENNGPQSAGKQVACAQCLLFLLSYRKLTSQVLPHLADYMTKPSRF